MPPALSQTWSRFEDPRPPCAFEASMVCETCGSHHISRLAGLFIDRRAERSAA